MRERTVFVFLTAGFAASTTTVTIVIKKDGREEQRQDHVVSGRPQVQVGGRCGHSLTVQGELFLTTVTEPNFYLNSPCFLEETTYSITYASIQLNLASFQWKVSIF